MWRDGQRSLPGESGSHLKGLNWMKIKLSKYVGGPKLIVTQEIRGCRGCTVSSRGTVGTQHPEQTAGGHRASSGQSGLEDPRQVRQAEKVLECSPWFPSQRKSS